MGVQECPDRFGYLAILRSCIGAKLYRSRSVVTSFLHAHTVLLLKPGSTDKPLRVHYPQVVDCAPVHVTHRDVLTPPLNAKDIIDAASQEDVQEYCNELSEWLALVSLDSPRVSAGDVVDPYLSRYTVPRVDGAKPSALVSVKWHGLIPSQWIMKLFIVLL